MTSVAAAAGLRTPQTKVDERRFFELVDGVETGSIKRVSAALADGADVSFYLSTGDTALGKAARGDSLAIVVEILDAARTKVFDRRWFDTAIIASASRPPGSIGAQAVEIILAAGADPNAATSNCTALQGAVYAWNVDTARLLLAAGADADAIALSFNVVPLAIAMGMVGRLYADGWEQTSSELVELLARAGANAAYIPQKGGWASPEQGFLTPYQYAMSKSRFDIVTTLTYLSGQDPLQLAADGRPMWDLIESGVSAKRAAAREFILSLATEVTIRGSVAPESGRRRDTRLDCCL
jgi:ankyrin repeat protein